MNLKPFSAVVISISIAVTASCFLFVDGGHAGSKDSIQKPAAAISRDGVSGDGLLRIPEPGARPSEVPAASKVRVPTVGDKIATLSSSFNANDRFEAYQLAYRCWTLKLFETQIRNTVQAERADVHPELDQYRGACDGVSDAQLAIRYENLKVAVASNIPGAAHQYLAEGPFGDNDALTQRPEDPLVVQWKEQVVAGLKLAAEAGDRVSLIDLMQIYDSGVIAPRDPVQSLTYLMVEDKIATQSGHPHTANYLQNAQAGYSPEQVRAATREAKSFFDRCCARQGQGS